MQRTAQKRSLLNKIREMADVGGIAAEKYFSPELKELMDHLRDVDDGVRAIAAGEGIGNAGAPEDAISLKDLLKSAKSNINKSEYMKSISDLGRFHGKIFEIARLLEMFKNRIDKVHERFLFQDMDDKTKEQLTSFKNKWKTASDENEFFIKEANSFFDFLSSITSNRGRALSAWEKKYPQRIKKLKEDMVALLASSEKLLGTILTSLKDLAKARSKRMPDNYIAITEKIINAVKAYDEGDRGFKKFYETHVKGFLEKQEWFNPTKTDDTSKPAELGKQDIKIAPFGGMTAPSSGTSPSIDQTQTVIKDPNFTKQLPLPKAPVAPGTFPKIPGSPQVPKMPPYIIDNTGRMIGVDPMTGEIKETENQDPNAPVINKTINTIMAPKMPKAHRNFYQILESLSSESPLLIGVYIKKYANSIMESDPETAIKLLQISKAIKG